MRIYLADLGHNQQTVSSDVYPLGVANLSTYTREYLRGADNLDIQLFREPEDLQAAIESAAPDVLGLSSYAWNHNLALAFARFVRERSPATLTLMGGPHFPLTAAEQETVIRDIPEIDVHVRGPTYEGERAFLNVVQRHVDGGMRREALFEEAVPGNVWIDPRNGDFVHGGEIERIRDLDDIPSPYLAGLMDPFLSTGYFPLLQITRGCPFTCAFCNSAVKSNSKAFRHSIENVQADLLYIAERVKPEMPVCFADDNFGMYPWDEEVADYIGHLQDRFGWPKYIRTTTGKNRAERIIRVMRKARGALPMTSAVQSMNPVVLKNIKRDNISLKAYAEIQEEVRAQGMQAYGELILGLPGETLASFMQAISDLLDTGVTRVSAHQLMLLYGAPLANPEDRKQHGFRTRFRVVARNIGRYLDRPVVETEEIVVETPTLSFEDYLEARVFHVLLTIFYYEGNFEEAFAYAQQQGLKPFDVIVRLQERLADAPSGFQQVIGDFVEETKKELFDTHDECVAWAIANWDQVVDGTLGGNLLSKYSMLGRFYATDDALTFLQNTLRDMLESDQTNASNEIEQVTEYLRAVMLHTPFAESVANTPTWRAEFDVEEWREQGYVQPLAAYLLDPPQEWVMRTESGRRAAIMTRVGTFGEHPSGLGKFTRTMFARDLRRTPSRTGTEESAA